MKKLIILVVLGICLFTINCKTASQDYITTSYNNGELMLPDLISYIQKDITIPEEQKTIRIDAINAWRALLKRAQDESQ